MGDSRQTKPVEIAAFDFDGTCISGNSPVILVSHLVRKGLLGKGTLLRILCWAAAYKLRLPQNESWVRGAVFSAFEGKKKEEVDEYLRDFYDSHLEKLFRAQANEVIEEHRAAGREVWAVTATFEPLIQQAMTQHGYTQAFSTRMKIDSDGRYTREVEGLPVEGSQKLEVLTREANARFGEGNWVLTHAYGDHHSDLTLLAAAEHPFAVTPDRPLRRTARNREWPILNWR